MIGDYTPRCPLCGCPDTIPFAEVGSSRYLDCPVCRMVHLDPAQRLAPEAERRHYDSHENDPDDPRYRVFLDRLVAPLSRRLEPGARGLDYGSGPGPAVAAMLAERGFPTSIYDPFFAPDSAALARSYDFITCTEVAEHFFHPGRELERLRDLLRPGGLLAIMTEILRDETVFERWRYARDPSHVCFYRERTMEWIAADRGWSLERPHPNVAIFQVGG